jgi:hypothetical protein
LPNENQLCAYLSFSGHIALATVTFYSVIQTPIVKGGFRENADLHFILPASAPLLFCLVDHTLGIALVTVLNVYWMQWSYNYTIVVNK